MDNKKDIFKPLEEMTEEERKDCLLLQKEVEIDMLKADVEFFAFTNNILLTYLIGVANGSVTPERVREELYQAVELLKDHPTLSEGMRAQLEAAGNTKTYTVDPPTGTKKGLN